MYIKENELFPNENVKNITNIFENKIINQNTENRQNILFKEKTS